VSNDLIPSTLDALKVPIDGLTPYGANPRRGNVSVIVESLARHGQYRPIVVRAKTFEVLAGNHTLAAAKELGWTEIAATFVDCTDDEAARIVLVDNRSADLGDYDDTALLELLEGLDADLLGTGYADQDLENLRTILDAAAWGDGPRSPSGDGDVDDPTFDPRIDLRVSTRVFEAWRQLLDQYDGTDDAAKLAAHLTAAGYLE